jgi:glycosyltransferase involved in cell wall biosynthesis
MRISVIVPTYRRTESLEACLDALAVQATQPAEIIVVHRPEDHASRRVAVDHPASIRCVEVKRSGVIAAMNAGVDSSSGDIVALTDDDAQPHPDWLTRLRDAYLADAAVASVGGRDRVFHDGVLEDGQELTVGTVNWFGRVTGNHHLGSGPARDVDVLKGVNLSVRGPLLRELRFDERLMGVGTEHHWELALCLSLRRSGHRIVYDPAIVVDHYPQPRAEGTRHLDAPVHVRNATHNATLAVLEFLPPGRRVVHMLWALGIGVGTAPGVAQSARSLMRSGDPHLALLKAALAGRFLGLRTFWRGA